MLQKEEAERLLKQTEQQVSILKASLDRATKAKDHAEAQVCAKLHALLPCLFLSYSASFALVCVFKYLVMMVMEESRRGCRKGWCVVIVHRQGKPVSKRVKIQDSRFKSE